MKTVEQLIDAIERCQPVLNKSTVDVQRVVGRVAELADADGEAVAFLAHHKYKAALAQTKAGVVLISQKFADDLPDIAALFLIVKDAYLAYASISVLFVSQDVHSGIHPTAVIDPSATLGNNVNIGAHSVIAQGVVIGDDSCIGAGSVIEQGVSVGRRCHIASHVTIMHSQIGDDVRIHSHASIGCEGFGFAPKVDKQGVAWQRIAQLGKVVIGHRVRIGANTCIDRGAVNDTVIGDDVIIDNLVQIAHNVRIGRGTAIAAKVGIAGSTSIGNHCVIGGAVGIAGHLHIADGVTLTAMTMVINHIKQAGVYSSGTVAMPSMQWRRAAVKFRQLGEKS